MNASTLSAPELVDDPDFARLKHHVIEATGLAYYAEQDGELARQLGCRLSALGLTECGTYWTLLRDSQAGQAELDTLIEALTIGETFFFRHQEQFDALAGHVLPELIERNQSLRRMRIWSAGCATGAEPYSLAILLERRWGGLLADWNVTILGTDINRAFLAQAQRGEFSDWMLRAMPGEQREACFSKTGQHWSILPRYRSRVSFQYHNLVKVPFPSLVHNLLGFDLILCRNVMIYFSEEINRQVIGRFYSSLDDEGFLIVGHAESRVDLFTAFETVNASGAVVYRKQRPFGRSANGETGTCRTHTPAFPAQAEPHRLPTEPIPTPIESRRPPAAAANTLDRVKAEAREEPWTEIRALTNSGHWTAAMDCCQSLTSRDRLNPLAHFYHALLLQQIGRHVEAEHALRRTIYLDRSFVLAHYHLGLLQQRNRNPHEARRSFRNAIRLLDSMSADSVFADADGLTAGALARLTEMHLEVLENQ